MTELPRLLDVNAAAAYLGGSTSVVRGYVASGQLTPVRLPSTRRPGELSRRLLFDVRDLDAFIDRQKRTSTSAPNAQLSAASVKGWRLSPERKRTA